MSQFIFTWKHLKLNNIKFKSWLTIKMNKVLFQYAVLLTFDLWEMLIPQWSRCHRKWVEIPSRIWSILLRLKKKLRNAPKSSSETNLHWRLQNHFEWVILHNSLIKRPLKSWMKGFAGKSTLRHLVNGTVPGVRMPADRPRIRVRDNFGSTAEVLDEGLMRFWLVLFLHFAKQRCV